MRFRAERDVFTECLEWCWPDELISICLDGDILRCFRGTLPLRGGFVKGCQARVGGDGDGSVTVVNRPLHDAAADMTDAGIEIIVRGDALTVYDRAGVAQFSCPATPNEPVMRHADDAGRPLAFPEVPES